MYMAHQHYNLVLFKTLIIVHHFTYLLYSYMTVMIFLYYICTSMYIGKLITIKYVFFANILFLSVYHGFLISSVISIMFLHLSSL